MVSKKMNRTVYRYDWIHFHDFLWMQYYSFIGKIRPGNLFHNHLFYQREKYNYFSLEPAFNNSMSCFKCRVNLVSFLNSFLNLIISLIKTNEKIRIRMDMIGNASIDHFICSFFASCLNCHPSRIGKKKRMMQPIANRPTAHSKFLMSHSKVNHSIFLNYLKEPK